MENNEILTEQSLETSQISESEANQDEIMEIAKTNNIIFKDNMLSNFFMFIWKQI